MVIAALLAIVSAAGAAAVEVIIVLDGSGSSAGQIGGVAKIDIARGALRSVLTGAAGDLSIGLVAYGHRQQENCSDFELITPPGAIDSFLAAADGVRSVGRSPIAAATAEAAAAVTDPDTATIIVITDNADNCSPNPCQTISEIHDEMPGLTISVVGIAIPAGEVAEISCFADITGGLYLRADTAADFQLNLDEAMSVALIDPLPPLPSATITLPGAVVQGGVFNVQYRGPTAIGDEIRIAWLGSPAEQYISGALVRADGAPIALTAPAEIGALELRYWHAERQAILTRVPLRVAAITPALDAPGTVQQGGDIVIGWRAGDPAGLAIQIVDPLDRAGATVAATRATRQEATVTLPAPAAIGTYEIRLVDVGNGTEPPLDLRNGPDITILAQATIEVVRADVRFGIDSPIIAGSDFEVTWDGPGGSEDEIRLAAVGMAKSDWLAAVAPQGTSVFFRAPFPSGLYELRYYSGILNEIVAIERIEIELPTASLEALELVEGGAPFEVSWTGPGMVGDRIVILQSTPDGDEILAAHRVPLFGRVVIFDAPIVPGSYEIAYLSAEGDQTLARLTFIASSPDVELTAPASIIVGETIVVEWTGPAGRSDEIRLIGPDLSSKILAATRLVPDTSALLTAPGPGRYRIVYWAGAWDAALKSIEIDVRCSDCSPVPDAELRLAP